MLDEMFQQKASKFAKNFWNTKTQILFVCFSLGKKVARNEKLKKNYVGFSYPKSKANFEVFDWNISSSINLLFLKNDQLDCSTSNKKLRRSLVDVHI